MYDDVNGRTEVWLDDARTHEGGNEEWRAGEARQRKDE
jgi:hypothetical protein